MGGAMRKMGIGKGWWNGYWKCSKRMGFVGVER